MSESRACLPRMRDSLGYAKLPKHMTAVPSGSKRRDSDTHGVRDAEAETSVSSARPVGLRTSSKEEAYIP